MYNKKEMSDDTQARLASAKEASGTLSAAEYERRKIFLDGLKGLTKSEYIEIVRIMQRQEAPFSENANGVFFNICTLTQNVFNDLELFMQFTQSNRKNLVERELYMSTLSTMSHAE